MKVFSTINVVCLVLLSLIAADVGAENIVISEVLYDPAATETGGEAVELYNPTNADVNIGGWVIATESSATDATIPSGKMLKAKSYFLITDIGWSTLRDDMNWPLADHEEAISLTNTDAGVALKNGSVIIDAVGWGNPLNISAGLFEGIPATGVAAGNSLMRNADTGDNSVDFIAGTPDLQNSSSAVPGGQGITITANVENAHSTTDSIALDADDLADIGVQIIPNVGTSRSLRITTQISNSGGEPSNVTSMVLGPSPGSPLPLSIVSAVNSTTWIFEGNFTMDYFDEPGVYTVKVGDMNMTFEYMSLLALEIDTNALDFSSLIPGSAKDVIGDLDVLSLNKATVKNSGNVQMDIAVSGQDLVSGADRMSKGNVSYTFDTNDFIGALSGSLSAAKTIDLNLAPGQVNELSFRLNVPLDAKEGSYSGKTTVAGVAG